MSDLNLYVGAYIHIPTTMGELSYMYEGCPKCQGTPMPIEHNFCYKCGSAKTKIPRKYVSGKILDVKEILRDCHCLYSLRLGVNYSSSAVLIPQEDLVYDCGCILIPPLFLPLDPEEIAKKREKIMAAFTEKHFLRSSFEEIKKHIPKASLEYGIVWFNQDQDED